MKLVIPEMSITILSVYALQHGCSQEEKDLIWNQVDGVMSRILSGKELIVAGHLNVRRDKAGVENGMEAGLFEGETMKESVLWKWYRHMTWHL